MARKPNEASSGLDAAVQAVKAADTAEDLRAAQAVLLPLLGFSLADTADIVGRDRYWVSRARNRAIRGQPAHTHGGRRFALLSEADEVALVKRAIIDGSVSSQGAADPTRTSLRRMLDERGGGSESTVTAMLDRFAGKLVKGATWSRISLHQYTFARLYSLEKDLAQRMDAIE